MNARRHKMLIHTNTEIHDHENIGTYPLLVVIACIVMQILANTGFPVIPALIEISGRKPHPRPGSNTFLQSGGTN